MIFLVSKIFKAYIINVIFQPMAILTLKSVNKCANPYNITGKVPYDSNYNIMCMQVVACGYVM